jgi:hypothetical protein
MKKRVIWKMFVFTILTLGIYRLYWFIKTRKEMMDLNPKIKIMSPFFLIIPVLLVIFAVGFFITDIVQTNANLPSYCQSSFASSGQQNYSPAPECQINSSIWPMVVFYIAILLYSPLIAIWLWGYSKGVELVTKEKTSFAIAMIVLLLVPDGIDILVIQDGFNKIAPAKN